MLDFIEINGNAVNLSVSGDTPLEVLEDILKQIESETINSVSVNQEETREIIRLDGNNYLQKTYRARFITSSQETKIDPDDLV